MDKYKLLSEALLALRQASVQAQNTINGMVDADNLDYKLAVVTDALGLIRATADRTLSVLWREKSAEKLHSKGDVSKLETTIEQARQRAKKHRRRLESVLGKAYKE